MGCGTHFLERLAFQGEKQAENCDFREGSIREKRLNWPPFSHFCPPNLVENRDRRGPDWSGAGERLTLEAMRARKSGHHRE